MKHITIIIVFFFWAANVQAQLPSEKPMSQVITPMMKEKLDKPKQAPVNNVLPSEQKTLPKAAEEAKLRSTKISSNQQDTSKLPSNKKASGKVIMHITKPKD